MDSKIRGNASRGLLVFLVLLILVSIITSCSLVEDKTSRTFKNLESEAETLPTDVMENDVPEDTADVTETDDDVLLQDDLVSTEILSETEVDSEDLLESTSTILDTIPEFLRKQVKRTKASEKTGETKETKAAPSSKSKTPKISKMSTVHAGPPYTVRVFVREQRVVVYGTNASGAEVPIRKMVTSTGTKSYPTPISGEKRSYYLGGGSSWVRFTKYGVSYHQYATSILGTRGSGYLFHSTSYKRMRKHNSLDVRAFNRLGKRSSHGCIRLNTADAKFMYNLPRGTKVKVLKSASGYNISGVPGLPKINIKVKKNDPRYGWDPYDPNKNNPWKKQISSPPRIVGTAQTIKAGDSFDYLKNVQAFDFANNKLKVTYKGTVDVNKPGTYEVVYTAKDSKGKSSTLKLKHVVEPAPTVSPTTTKTESPTTTTTEPTTATTTESTTATTTESATAEEITSAKTTESTTATSSKSTSSLKPTPSPTPLPEPGSDDSSDSGTGDSP